MDLSINSVVTESPNFMDLGLSPTSTTDKLKSVIGPTTIFEGLMDISNWIAYTHGCKKLTMGIVSEAKAFIDYIKKMSLKL